MDDYFNKHQGKITLGGVEKSYTFNFFFAEKNTRTGTTFLPTSRVGV